MGMPWGAAALGLSSWMLPIGAVIPSALWWRSLQHFEKLPNAITCRRFFLDSLTYLLVSLALFTAYARAELPAPAPSLPAESGEVDSDQESRPPRQFIGPAWRAAVHEQCSELCPHEQVRSFYQDTLRAGCQAVFGVQR